MKHLISFVWLLFLIASAFSQSGSLSELDRFFYSLSEANKAMGSIAISKCGKMLYTKAFGYSFYSDNEKVPVDEKTKYRIGSISKTFTSTIIFQLIEEGKISPETPLSKYFPDFPNAGLITISNLLNHRSGIRNYTKIKSQDRPRSRGEMMKMISKSTPRFLPGKRTLYSNANYMILGYIIEKVLNKSFEEALEERIVSKIGLNDTYYGHQANIKNNESFCFNFEGRWVPQPLTDLSIPGASGSILSTPTDLTGFIEALFSKKLISQNSLDKMKTIKDNYGMGIVEFEFHTKKAYGQVGGIDHFESVVAYFPGDSLAIAFCTNGRVEPVKDIVINALNIYFGYVYDNPDFKLLGSKPKGLSKYIGVYSGRGTPAKIIITKNKQGLVAQSAGYPLCPLEAVGVRKFRCESARMVIKFNSRKKKFTLKQDNTTYNFTKEY
jgi:D-alanyl-D-alanine carboxypeptidase